MDLFESFPESDTLTFYWRTKLADQQMEEIDQLNQELAPFRVFKSIESDILNDGSLDYEEEVLKAFDFIIRKRRGDL